MLKRGLFIAILAITAALFTGCAVATTANIVEVAPQPEIRTVSAHAVQAPATPTAAPMAVSPAPIPSAIPVTAASTPTELPTLAPEASLQPSAAPTPTPTATPTATPTKTPEKTPAYQVTDIEDTQGYVYAKSINLRSGPGTDYKVVKEYEQYTEVTITGKTEDWYEVEIGSREGFMLQEYVKAGAAPTATPKATEKPKATATPTQAPSIENNSSLTDEQYIAAKVVHLESGSDGYLAVANVIYNRVKSGKYPNTIQGVCYQSGQFTVVDDSDFATLTPSSGAISAVHQIFVEGNTILPADVMFFRPSRKGTTWGSRTYYATIGGNNFFS